MRKMLITLLSITILFTIIAIPVHANPADTMDVWVYDDGDLLSEETKQYVNQMNEKFNEKATPTKFAIILTGKLPRQDMDMYMQSMFQEYGMSYTKDSYDVLVYIAVQDKKYDIEYGGAYDKEDASLINQDLKISMFDEDVKAHLYEEDYDKAIMNIAQHFEKMMNNVDTGYYIEATERIRKTKIVMGAVLVVIMIGVIVGYVIDYKKKNQADINTIEKTKKNGS